MRMTSRTFRASDTAGSRALLSMAVLALALTSNGCSTACTLIGCSDGVSVELAGALPASYTVTLRIAGEADRTVECTPDRQCGGRMFFEGVTPGQAEIEVQGTGVSVRRQVAPSYRTAQPNGRGCPPVCRQATVRVQL
jgi:hypothetical protein